MVSHEYGSVTLKPVHDAPSHRFLAASASVCELTVVDWPRFRPEAAEKHALHLLSGGHRHPCVLHLKHSQHQGLVGSPAGRLKNRGLQFRVSRKMLHKTGLANRVGDDDACERVQETVLPTIVNLPLSPSF